MKLGIIRSLGSAVVFSWMMTQLLSCNQNKAGNAGGEDQDPELIEEEDDFASTTDPVAIAGVNLTYSNARMVCDHQRVNAETAIIYARAVADLGDGTTITPAGIQDGLSLQINRPRIDNQEYGNCETSQNPFFFACEINDLPVQETISVECSYQVAEGDKKREPSTTINLTYSVGQVIGNVPHMPHSYTPLTQEQVLQLTDPNETVKVDGYEQKPKNDGQLKLAAGSIFDLCHVKGKIFFSSTSGIFKMEEGKISAFAGSSQSNLQDDFSNRYRINFGSAITLACNEEGIFVGDNTHQRILKVPFTGAVELIAGGGGYGFSADGTVANGAKLRSISALAWNPKTKQLYFSEHGLNRIRTIEGDKLRTVIGDGTDELLDKDPYLDAIPLGWKMKRSIEKVGDWTLAVKTYPINFVTNPGAFSDNCIRGIMQVNQPQIFTRFCIAESEKASFDPKAKIGRVSDMIFDADGNLYFSNEVQHTIQKLAPDGTLQHIAGKAGEPGNSPDGTLAQDAFISHPHGLAFSPSGTMVFASNTQIRELSKDGKLKTLAGYIEDVPVHTFINTFSEAVLKYPEVFSGQYLRIMENEPVESAKINSISDLAWDHKGQLIATDRSQLFRFETASNEALTLKTVDSITQFSLALPNANQTICKETPLKDIVLGNSAFWYLDADRIMTLRGGLKSVLTVLDLKKQTAYPIYGCGANDLPLDRRIGWGTVAKVGDDVYILNPNSEEIFPTDVDLYRLDLKTLKISVVKRNAFEASFALESPYNTAMAAYQNNLVVSHIGGGVIRSDSKGNLYWASNIMIYEEKETDPLRDATAKVKRGFRIAKYSPSTQNYEIVYQYIEDKNFRLLRLDKYDYFHSWIGYTAFDLDELDQIYFTNVLDYRIYQLQESGPVAIAGNGILEDYNPELPATKSPIRPSPRLEVIDSDEIIFQPFEEGYPTKLIKKEDGNWYIRRLISEKTNSNCATVINQTGSATSQEALVEEIKTSSEQLCHGVVTYVTTFDTCNQTENPKRKISYSSNYSAYHSLITIETDCPNKN